MHIAKSIIAVLLTAIIAGGCATAPPNDVEQSAEEPKESTQPQMTVELGEALSIRTDLLPQTAKVATGSWHAFARPKYNGRINGSVPAVQDLAKDFAARKTKYFRDNQAREIVINIGKSIRPELIKDGEDVSRLLGQVAARPDDIRLMNCANAVQGRLLEAAAIDDAGNIHWTERECDPDETVVELKARDGSWVPWFSVKCLNPLNGTWHTVTKTPVLERDIGAATTQDFRVPPKCEVWHPIPGGPVVEKSGWFQTQRHVYLFLSEAEASCIPPGWTCPSRDCIDWMAGYRDPVPDAIHKKWRDQNGTAVEVKEGVAGVWMPKDASPWYCDTTVHGLYDADPLPPKPE